MKYFDHVRIRCLNIKGSSMENINPGVVVFCIHREFVVKSTINVSFFNIKSRVLSYVVKIVVGFFFFT